jgi:BirA family transcriptional regulator, biotin operon repressor / biotin---[acetyl-CoA-carboxylase] ligase
MMPRMPNHEGGPDEGFPGDLDPARVARAAAPWGLASRFLAETGSTNADVAAWVPDLPPAGGLVVADRQTAGRGRLDRTWFSPPGDCLLFSMGLRHGFEPARLGLVPLAAGVAACSAARWAGTGARLKWPNDLMIGGRKAGGILCEAVRSTGSAGWVVVGVGINVNVTAGDFPPELRETATSLLAESGRRVDRAILLERFLEAFLPLVGELGEEGGGALLERYRELCETLGTRIQATTGAGVLDATAVDVDRTGALVLDSGKVLHAADIVHLFGSG